MIILSFIEPPIENNNYLLIDEDTKEAALIDCSYADEKIQNAIKKHDAQLKYIMLTHGHFDHVAGIKESDAQIIMHKNDLKELGKANQYLSMFGVPNIKIPKVDKYVEDGDIISLGSYDIKVIYTPGHTQGGVCYLVDNNLFSGDTIFREAIGRCDMDGGDFNQLVHSIKTKIFTLADDIKVFPGHGPSSTVGWEKQHNQFL